MPTQVEARKCPKCKTKYRTKVKKGKDTKKCPGCRQEPDEASSQPKS